MKILNRLGTFILLSCFAISTLADSVVTYYHTDPLGSPIATTNQFGEIKWTERYEPFGERIDNPSASVMITFGLQAKSKTRKLV